MKLAICRRSKAARALIERVLRDGTSIEAEYPLVFAPPGSDASSSNERASAIATAEVDGAVRAACTLLVRDLVTPVATLRVGLIGSVATEEEFRGRGLARAVLGAAEDELRARGCIATLLWADEPAFYERLGYRALGAEHDFMLPIDVAAKLPEPIGVRERESRDDASIHALYSRHRERVAREPAETAALLRCPSMETLVREHDGAVVAYTCLGRGHDFTDVVHEWGGSVDDVLRLVRAHFERRRARAIERDLYLIAPPSARKLATALRKVGIEPAVGILGMGKWLDVLACAELVLRLADNAGRVRCTINSEDRIRFESAHGHATCSSREVFELLFAPRGERGLVQALSEMLGVACERLPLTPFVWGLDSI